MSIAAALVAYQQSIVAEDNLSSNNRAVVSKMLERLPRYDTKVSYEYEQNVYHFVIENEIVYGCMSTSQYENRTVYGYLMQVRDTFKTQFAGSPDRYPRASLITATNCAKFGATLSSQRTLFNNNPQADKLGQIRAQVDSTRQVMLDNLDSVVQRGDKIDSLCDRTELLRDEAQGFHSSSRSLKRALCIHHVKIVLGVIILLAIIALIIAWSVCGINFKKC